MKALHVFLVHVAAATPEADPRQPRHPRQATAEVVKPSLRPEIIALKDTSELKYKIYGKNGYCRCKISIPSIGPLFSARMDGMGYPSIPSSPDNDGANAWQKKSHLAHSDLGILGHVQWMQGCEGCEGIMGIWQHTCGTIPNRSRPLGAVTPLPPHLA